MIGLNPHVLAGGLMIAALLGAAGAARAGDATERAQLERLTQRSVFFGHQSVGMNVLDGLLRLEAARGTALRVVDAPLGAAIPAGTIGHAWIGENHRPETKLEAFARALDALPAPGVDIALLKLCYVDFTADTDAASLLGRYRQALERLSRRHPRTIFVHVTAPLSTVQGGARGLVKRLLGRAPYGLVENVRREEYNSLLRQAFGGKAPLFDLAAVESTRPDGTTETVTWNGHTVPSLAPDYTDDGGHLNAAGQEAAARALLAVLVALPPSPPPVTP